MIRDPWYNHDYLEIRVYGGIIPACERHVSTYTSSAAASRALTITSRRISGSLIS